MLNQLKHFDILHLFEYCFCVQIESCIAPSQLVFANATAKITVNDKKNCSDMGWNYIANDLTILKIVYFASHMASHKEMFND